MGRKTYTEPKGGYGFKEKLRFYREPVYHWLKEAPMDIKREVLVMLPGREGLELDYAHAVGFRPKNIIGVDFSNAVAATLSRKWRQFGATFRAGEVGEICKKLAQGGVTAGYLSLDYCTTADGAVESLVQVARSGILKPGTRIAVTILRGRDHTATVKRHSWKTHENAMIDNGLPHQQDLMFKRWLARPEVIRLHERNPDAWQQQANAIWRLVSELALVDRLRRFGSREGIEGALGWTLQDDYRLFRILFPFWRNIQHPQGLVLDEPHGEWISRYYSPAARQPFGVIGLKIRAMTPAERESEDREMWYPPNSRPFPPGQKTTDGREIPAGYYHFPNFEVGDETIIDRPDFRGVAGEAWEVTMGPREGTHCPRCDPRAGDIYQVGFQTYLILLHGAAEPWSVFVLDLMRVRATGRYVLSVSERINPPKKRQPKTAWELEGDEEAASSAVAAALDAILNGHLRAGPVDVALGELGGWKTQGGLR